MQKRLRKPQSATCSSLWICGIAQSQSSHCHRALRSFPVLGPRAKEKRFASARYRMPPFSAISRISLAGKSLAIYLRSKLTLIHASDQWQRDWMRLISYLGKDEKQKEQYLEVVKTIAPQLQMEPASRTDITLDYAATKRRRTSLKTCWPSPNCMTTAASTSAKAVLAMRLPQPPKRICCTAWLFSQQHDRDCQRGVRAEGQRLGQGSVHRHFDADGNR